MLRDVLTKLSGFATWPCDEINYIWRHGHTSFPLDEFPADFANNRRRKFIKKKFAWVANKYHAEYVVEKTCANSLRVEYIYRLLPEAKFVFIYRNGLDVVGSAMKRWKAPLDVLYIAKKARFVPYTDLPYYASKYFASRLHRLFSKENRLGVWGPRGKTMDDLKGLPLDEICARQWKSCVDASRQQSEAIPEENKTTVCYENFVNHPVESLLNVLQDLNIPCNQAEITAAVEPVSNTSVNKGINSLTSEQKTRLLHLVSDSMSQHGYA